MRFEAIPTIKLEIQNMKSAIMTQLGLVGSDLGKTLSGEIDKAVASYDFQGEVTEIVHKAIRNHVEGYFKYGNGHSVISDAVESALENALSDQPPE